ncbi:UNVERIFIED_CONTAM: hypothetical protein Sangu_2732900 [Sesamum angustifolium]|uniref:Secreted protein n=1 Tax=Sesamum angustifolium TaxID=2727405 RepID=A0AAW2IVQ7_9LAMI
MPSLAWAWLVLAVFWRVSGRAFPGRVFRRGRQSGRKGVAEGGRCVMGAYGQGVRDSPAPRIHNVAAKRQAVGRASLESNPAGREVYREHGPKHGGVRQGVRTRGQSAAGRMAGVGVRQARPARVGQTRQAARGAHGNASAGETYVACKVSRSGPLWLCPAARAAPPHSGPMWVPGEEFDGRGCLNWAVRWCRRRACDVELVACGGQTSAMPGKCKARVRRAGYVFRVPLASKPVAMRKWRRQGRPATACTTARCPAAARPWHPPHARSCPRRPSSPANRNQK